MRKKEKEQDEKGLKDYGIIYVSGSINDGTSESVCKEIIEFNITGEVDHIQMIINSPGGSCPAAFAIIDIMEWSRLPIYTTGLGMIASMGLLMFMTGMKGRRVITPRTSILSHRFSWITAGNHSQLLASRKEEDLEHRRIVDHYLRYTNIDSQEKLEEYLLRDVDTWLSPEECIKFGIADIVEKVTRQAA
ncbi:MAG: ATP-dependent Clp protease proteolytic subunit [Desulfobulbaceae bacterium]|nr:ATP-dependent Clp protease proteolytic subunit [Desulfobulbaceae bacterium]